MRLIAFVLALGAAAGSASMESHVSARDNAIKRAVSDSSLSSATATQVAMRNVNFYVTPTAALRIRSLRGEMRSLRAGPVVFDDKTSFVIRISSAEVGLNGNDLTRLLNDVVFAYPGAPLKKMKVRIVGTQLLQSGVMHKVVDIPFQMATEVSVTTDGLIRLHPVRTQILGINGNGLMRAFGLSLEKILDLRRARGVTVKGNDLLLNPAELLPPPAFEGHLTAVRIDGDQLVQTFGTRSSLEMPELLDHDAQAYMFYKGGTLRFGKLLMLDADMQIVGLRRDAIFGFNLDRYKEQLIAGYSRTLENSGLEVFMATAESLTGRKVATLATPPNVLH